MGDKGHLSSYKMKEKGVSPTARGEEGAAWEITRNSDLAQFHQRLEGSCKQGPQTDTQPRAVSSRWLALCSRKEQQTHPTQRPTELERASENSPGSWGKSSHFLPHEQATKMLMRAGTQQPQEAAVPAPHSTHRMTSLTLCLC